MLQLAANSPDRPATYTIPSADDLNKVRQSSNIITVISDLQRRRRQSENDLAGHLRR